MRLATFNILHGRSPSDGQVHLPRLRTAVAELDADVLALQEVDRAQPRSQEADLTALAADAMRAPEHRFMATLAGTPDVWTAVDGDLQPGIASYGIALLSRHPVLTWRTLTLPRQDAPAEVLHPGDTAPSMVLDEPRTAIAAVIRTPAGVVTVVATHLTFVPGWNTRQLESLVEQVADLPRPAVLMGDLNIEDDLPASITGWRPLACAPTFPVARPLRQLDHILADGDLHPVGPGRAIDTGMSDHRALVVDTLFG